MPKRKGRARLLADEIFESSDLLGFPMALVAAECLMNVAKMPMSCQCSDIAEHVKVVDLGGSNPSRQLLVRCGGYQIANVILL